MSSRNTLGRIKVEVLAHILSHVARTSLGALRTDPRLGRILVEVRTGRVEGLGARVEPEHDDFFCDRHSRP